MNKFILAFALVLLTAQCAVSDLKTEEEALSYLANVEQEKEKFDPSLIKKCIELSWWKAGEKTILLAFQYGFDISSEFSAAVSKQRTNIQKLQNIINKNKEDYFVISPSFQWAQGKTDLKMNIKLAHKWDSPATLGCTVESVKFEPSNVYFEAKCPSSKTKYVLNLTLMKQINPNFCSWNEAAVGRIVLNMKKSVSGLWDNIIVKHPRMPRNIHTWWSMKDQLEKEDYEKDLAEERKLDEQRMAAEKIYWEQKRKEREEKEKAETETETETETEAEAETETAVKEAGETKTETKMGTETVKETVEKEHNEVEL